MWIRVLWLVVLLLPMRAAFALEIPPLEVGAGAGIATVYLNPARGQLNVPTVHLQAEAGNPELSLEARAGASARGGDKQLSGGSLLTVQFDYFYSLMLKSGLELFDPANRLFFQGGWSKFRMRSTTNAFDTLSNRASFGFGVGLRRQLSGKFGVSAEYMRYSADIRAASLSLDYAL